MAQKATLTDLIKADPRNRVQISKDIGVSRQLLWRWEKHGKPIERIDHLLALARELGVRPVDIVPELGQ